MKHQHIVDRLNERGSENLHPFVIFLIAFALAIWIMTFSDNANAADLDSRTFVKIIACESSWQEHQRGDGETSFGLPQFKRETFRWMAKAAMRDQRFVQDFHDIEPRIRRPVFNYPSHKMLVAQWAMSQGYGKRHWQTCYNKFATVLTPPISK